VRLHDGRYECAHRGAVLDIPLTPDPHVAISAASDKPNIRTPTLDGKEIHSCEIRPLRDLSNASEASESR
jgi:hypothetical protein